MLNYNNSMKLIVVAAVYITVALIVTGALVLRSNNVMASAHATIEAQNVVEKQHVSLDQRYEQFADLSRRVIDQEVVLQMLDEALDIADQYVCEELNQTNGQRALQVLLRETGAMHKLRALPQTPMVQNLLNVSR